MSGLLFVCSVVLVFYVFFCLFFFSSRRRHTRCALVTGVQTCALPISGGVAQEASINPSIKLQRAVTCRSGLAVFQVQPGSSVSLPVRRSPADRKSVV